MLVCNCDVCKNNPLAGAWHAAQQLPVPVPPEPVVQQVFDPPPNNVIDMAEYRLKKKFRKTFK